MRIPPLDPPYSEEAAAVLAKWMPPGSTEPLRLFRLLAGHPVLSERLRALGAFQLGKESSLALRDREILIDRACARCGCEYEWGVHATAFGRAAGLSDDQLDATVVENADAGWSVRDRLLLDFADALHDRGRVPGELWSSVRAEWSDKQILEMTTLVGFYHLVSFVANVAELELEPWARRFPRLRSSFDRLGRIMDAIKQRQQQTWATGDFSKVGAEQIFVGERLCEYVVVHAGDRVLDVATGSGNTALAAARRGCEVTGVDFVEALLERGRERAAAERLQVTFEFGDTEALPFPDATFDVVLSTFGAMFAPDPVKAASELARVCRPGGKIGMANWTPEGLPGQMFKLNAKYLPPPPGEPPVLWGVEAKVRERFGKLAADVKSEKQTAYFRALSAAHWVEFMKTYFGPTIRTFAALAPEEQEKLTADLIETVGAHNRSTNATLLGTAEYLQVMVRRA